MRLMLIDDDPASHLFHQIMIERAGIPSDQVVVCYSADEAIAHLQQILSMDLHAQWPQVIILDLNMPQKSGWDFIETYRELAPGIKQSDIYIVSNSESPQDKAKAQEIPEVKEMRLKFLDVTFFEELQRSVSPVD